MSSAAAAGLFQPLRQEDPSVVGGYRLAAVLGAGGMGKVYLTYTPGGRPIALKVIRPEFSEDPEFRRRFKQEVHSAQRVQGLYTAPVIDCDTEGPQPWLATAYVPGPSLAHAVAEHGALPLRSVLLLTVGVAEALHVIHGARIVHRDLKPANVLLAADGPRVIDFGIARAADATALTGSGVTVGTPTFMAPEQALSGTVTPATDIFALGQIAAYAAIGAPAYGDGPSHAVLYRIVHESPDLSALPDEVRPLVTRCLSRDPADRPTLPEIIELCNELSPTPLRQGEDWLPKSVAGSITERLQLPAPVPTPPPTPAAPPPPTEVSGPGGPNPYAPTRFAPGAPHAAPTQAAGTAPSGFPGTPPPVPGPSTPPPVMATPPPVMSAPPLGHATPPPVGHGYVPPPVGHGYVTPPPVGTGFVTPPPVTPVWGAPPPRKKSKAWVVALAVVGGLVVVCGVIGALVPEDKDKGSSAGSSGSSDTGGSGSGGSDDGSRPDPKPATYKGINIPDEYYVVLADNPPRPAESENAAYGSEDLSFEDQDYSDDRLSTENGKFVLLNNSQKGSLETCRAETRFTKTITLDQLTTGSEFCVLSDAGHIAVVTYKGRSGASDPSKYVSLDITVWRNAEDPADSE